MLERAWRFKSSLTHQEPMRKNKKESLDYLRLFETGWDIVRSYNDFGDESIHPEPICVSCRSQLTLKNDRTLFCEMPNCTLKDREINLPNSFLHVSGIVRRAWEGKRRRATNKKWVNLEQELLRLGESEDESDNYWVKAKLLKVNENEVLMVLVGRKDLDGKVHFFVKDGLNLTVFDQSDIDPKELFLSFQANFSDGSISKTTYKKPKSA